MIAASTTVSGIAPSAGYLLVPRGLQFSGYSPDKHGPLWNYRLLPARAGDAGALLFLFIYDRTWSALNAPEWADITLPEFCAYFSHKTPEAIRKELKKLEEIQFIERHPDHPWRFKTHPEKIEAAPVRERVKHPNAAAKKRKARSASVFATTGIAALARTEPINRESGRSPLADRREIETGFMLPSDWEQPEDTPLPPASDVAQINSTHALNPISKADGGQSSKLVPISCNRISEFGAAVSAEPQTGMRLDETRCSHGWACPFLSSELNGRKPLSLLNPNASKPSLPAAAEIKPAEEAERTEIRQLLLDEWRDVIPGDYPGDQVCERIHRALQGAPLDWVTTDSRGIPLLRHKLRSRAFKTDSYGKAECIAADVGKAWRAQADTEHQRQIEQRRSTIGRMTARVEDAFGELHRSWAAPKELAAG